MKYYFKEFEVTTKEEWKAKPKYHLFGHIHSTAGETVQFGDTKCINISRSH